MAINSSSKAERFTTTNSLRSSGFSSSLSKDITDELEERCHLYLQYAAEESRNLPTFRNFFKNEEKGLRASVSSRFGIEVPGKDACEVIQEKYEALLSLQKQETPKRPIGFHT